jgi:glycine cleavage system H protein
MEGFSIVDIYETKGVEYLFVIAYLVVFIIFWRVIRNPGQVLRQIRDAVSTLSAKILKIPQGIYFSKNHTWTHLGESGAAKVGLDDFLQHVVGELQLAGLKDPGDSIKKGELLAEIEQGGKQLRVYSPISGEVLETNTLLTENPEMINSDPYNKGWLYQVKPSNWMKETSSLLLAEKASEWSEKEISRFKDFLSMGAMRKYSSEPAMATLQDGGEIRDHVLSELPEEVWKDFQKEFLNA